MHTLASSKVKDNIVISKPFSEESGEKVFKFVKDFQVPTAADQDHVREVDMVKKLMISKEAMAQDSIGVNVNKHSKNTFEAELLDAIDMGTKKSTAEIKVDDDAKKPTVKTIALILIAGQKFKKLLIKKKRKEGKADIDGLQSLNLPPPKFTPFTVSPCEPVVKTKADPVKEFRAGGVLTKSAKVMMLTDEELGASLENGLKKTTEEVPEEVLMFHDKKAVDKTGVMKDDVLFSKSRLLENQNVRAVGALEIHEDLKSFIGENHVAPVIDKLSPIAVSISLHLHYNVLPHRGAETLYTLSLRHAKIILGWTLMEKFSEKDDLKENYVVYFKLPSSALSPQVAHW